MKPAHLDFGLARRPAGPVAWLILLCGIASAAAVVARDRNYWQPRNEALESRLASLRKAADARREALPRMDDARLMAEWSRAMAVADELSLPWEALFTTFEAAADQPVAVLSLEPDAGKQELMLTCEARNTAAMLGYYRHLQEQKIFSGLELHTHQVNRQDQEKPIRFRITAHWGASS